MEKEIDFIRKGNENRSLFYLVTEKACAISVSLFTQAAEGSIFKFLHKRSNHNKSYSTESLLRVIDRFYFYKLQLLTFRSCNTSKMMNK